MMATTSILSNADLAHKAVQLAERLLQKSRVLESKSERAEAKQLAGLMDDSEGKELTFHLTDRVLRVSEPARAGQLFRSLLEKHGLPNYLSPLDRAMMGAGGMASKLLPAVVMPAITNRIRKESRRVILPAAEESLAQHISARRSQGARINLNLLGEAVLSEDEALSRLNQNITALTTGTTDYLSVKLSAIFSQINLTAYEDTIATLAERLRLLYRAAKSQSPAAFVNLDMEEYRDLHLTLDVFKSVLAEPEFHKLRAGIVLQAYLPDAHPMQIELTEWARQRVANGGATIKVRLVKGANLAMECVDADLHDWPLAPYSSKEGVDANYKRMLHYACQPGHARYVQLGVASHNLFDISLALVLREAHGVQEFVELEMLEGMASPQARAVLEEAGSLLFYAPAVKDDDFEAAIAYLIRRLDENTTPGNFLRDLFQIEPGNEAWNRQCQAFLTACKEMDQAEQGPKRRQNRNTENPLPASGAFHNEADTDFSLPQNRQWLREGLTTPLPSMVTPLVEDPEAIEKAIATASHSTWKTLPLSERAELLRRAGVELAKARGALIAIMNREAKKAPSEGDVEVSEAIDFANYYSDSLSTPEWADGLRAEPIGPILITPPWNFPCAIPCGGILAALAAGNAVIIKPAPEVIATARLMVECLWKAGIPQHALQFLPVPDDHLGQSLVTDPRIAAVVLTGSSQTAHMFLRWRPQLRVFAETSGKNSLIISSASDPDLAIKDLVKSAFNHSGQKCSAASIALVERSLLEKTTFLERLRAAASSLLVGPAHKPGSIITPLVQPPSPALKRGLTKLDGGEQWLLEPNQPDFYDDCLWTPGIRIHVQTGSWIHQTELFGPVLAIIAYDTLEEAIRIQNSTSFGLTGGIHSLDPAEIAQWRESVEVGNAYINRPITGAIVRRQPFGGWKNSSMGPGAKAGGPNYVSQFIQAHTERLPLLQSEIPSLIESDLSAIKPLLNEEDGKTLTASLRNGAYWWKAHFELEHDPSAIAAESNIFRYKHAPAATLRLTDDLSLLDGLITTLLGKLANVMITWSSATPPAEPFQLAAKALAFPIVLESDDELKTRLSTTPLAVLRTPGRPSTSLHARNHHASVTPHARLELLAYLYEQSLSETRHRHGRLLK